MYSDYLKKPLITNIVEPFSTVFIRLYSDIFLHCKRPNTQGFLLAGVHF